MEQLIHTSFLGWNASQDGMAGKLRMRGELLRTDQPRSSNTQVLKYT